MSLRFRWVRDAGRFIELRTGLRYFHILEAARGPRVMHFAIASPTALRARCIREVYIRQARVWLYPEEFDRRMLEFAWALGHVQH